MIPTVLLIALVGAILIPRHPLWIGLGATTAWAVIVLFEDSSESLVGFFGTVALGAANAAVAVAGVWVVRRVAVTD